jgi:Homeodomain-like domain
MRTGVVVHLSPTDRKRLRSIVDDRNSLQKHVWRARIVLATADGVGTVEIMRTAGISKTAVWRWQARFMDEGVEGLLRDKTRPPGTPRVPLDVAERVVALTLCALHAHLRQLAQRRRGLLRHPHQASSQARRFQGRRRSTGRHQPLRRRPHNLQSKPFVWTADPDKIIAAAARGHQVLESIR